MYGRQPASGGPLFVLTVGVGIAAAWMWICHPGDAENIAANSSNGRDLVTLGVLMTGALLCLTVFAGAWMLILGVLSKLAGLLLIVAFGFGCFVAYQNYFESRAIVVPRSGAMYDVGNTVKGAPLTASSDAGHSGTWWAAPADHEVGE